MTYTKIRSLGDLSSINDATDEAHQDRMVEFIRRYQTYHDGMTPTTQAIANELGTLAVAVNLMLVRAENRGLLSIVSRSPLRIMFDMKDRPERPDAERYTRYLEADAMRHKLGRYIGECVRKSGYGPTLREAMIYVGIDNAAYVARMADILAEHGIIKKSGAVLSTARLTPSGEALYRLRPTEEDKMDKTEINPVAKPKRPYTNPKNMDELVGMAIANFFRVNGDSYSPEFKELNLGYSYKSHTITQSVNRLAEQGYLLPRPKGAKRSLHFTDKGHARFMPETMPVAPEPVAERQMHVPMAPVPMPSPAKAERPAQPLVTQVVREWMEVPAPTTCDYAMLRNADTADMILELIDRGYIVKRGN